MLTSEQRKSLQPLLKAIEQAHQDAAGAAEMVEQLENRLSAVQESREAATATIAVKEAAHKEAVQAGKSRSGKLWQELKELRAATEEQDAQVAAVREQLAAAESSAARVKQAISHAERAYHIQLHACLVEDYNRAVRALYDEYLAPVWFIEHIAALRYREHKGGLEPLGPGIREFNITLPALRGVNPGTGERNNMLDRANHVRIVASHPTHGPGVEPEQADAWLEACCKEIEAA